MNKPYISVAQPTARLTKTKRDRMVGIVCRKYVYALGFSAIKKYLEIQKNHKAYRSFFFQKPFCLDSLNGHLFYHSNGIYTSQKLKDYLEKEIKKQSIGNHTVIQL